MRSLIDLLHAEHCSLVLRAADGTISTYSKPGVRDLESIHAHQPYLLRDAQIADKVIGRAAAAYMALGGVREVYADVLSRHALPVLDSAGIAYSYAQLVDAIVIPEGDTRCRLEELTAHCTTASDIVSTLRQHFREMQGR